MCNESHGRTKHWEYGIKHGSKENADDEQGENRAMCMKGFEGIALDTKRFHEYVGNYNGEEKENVTGLLLYYFSDG